MYVLQEAPWFSLSDPDARELTRNLSGKLTETDPAEAYKTFIQNRKLLAQHPHCTRDKGKRRPTGEAAQ